jgi:hypothetical protein
MVLLSHLPRSSVILLLLSMKERFKMGQTWAHGSQVNIAADMGYLTIELRFLSNTELKI